MDILVVCTGNACRSPMAEALLARHLAARGVEARVHSAGTRPWNVGATEHSITVMRDHGLDLSGHQNRPLTDEIVARADLVLGMTRSHVDLAVSRCRGAAGRTFLVGELARLGGEVGARRADESPREWAARVAAARPAHRPLGRAIDEIDDPAGSPIDVYRRTAETLDAHLATIAALLAGLPVG